MAFESLDKHREGGSGVLEPKVTQVRHVCRPALLPTTRAATYRQYSCSLNRQGRRGRGIGGP